MLLVKKKNKICKHDKPDKPVLSLMIASTAVGCKCSIQVTRQLFSLRSYLFMPGNSFLAIIRLMVLRSSQRTAFKWNENVIDEVRCKYIMVVDFLY